MSIRNWILSTAGVLLLTLSTVVNLLGGCGGWSLTFGPAYFICQYNSPHCSWQICETYICDATECGFQQTGWLERCERFYCGVYPACWSCW